MIYAVEMPEWPQFSNEPQFKTFMGSNAKKNAKKYARETGNKIIKYKKVK